MHHAILVNLAPSFISRAVEGVMKRQVYSATSIGSTVNPGHWITNAYIIQPQSILAPSIINRLVEDVMYTKYTQQHLQASQRFKDDGLNSEEFRGESLLLRLLGHSIRRKQMERLAKKGLITTNRDCCGYSNRKSLVLLLNSVHHNCGFGIGSSSSNCMDVVKFSPSW
ncbi:hypothetical protein K493DRAFT_299435 [Basidiobolus meristosporus CBS 931.73]|uniref:Uncharacterized protein n=1 Tax=Basidiobolus meristosporus CBS 931.73 TaxID=1314790 RepID=A0A1Y1YMT3_9FUNG|nr:hypothetical protein K493DRAFT_299435 [Basidiobolus meristosporus CBS 931.73]|eukprot:ORX99327.1 hypothetical protein K493DRAFT_299435 [Basidiobolus meristosporus CBS 931.73]